MLRLSLMFVFIAPPAALPPPMVQASSPTSLPAMDRTVLAMGTELRLHLEGAGDLGRASESALGESARIEAACSTWNPASTWSRLNAAQGVPVPLAAEWMDLLGRIKAWTQRTEGAFDPVLMALMQAWGVRQGGRTPDPGTLAAARRASGAAQLDLDVGRGAARLRHPRAGIEEGGFLKGYALDAMRKAAGVPSGWMNFGGQVLAWGRPSSVDIADPQDRQRTRCTVTLKAASLSSSGTSERGRHILDPRSGEPCPAWGSTAVVAADALSADVLSTALYVLGPDAGPAWAERHGVAAAFFLNDGKVRMTRAFRSLHPTLIPREPPMKPFLTPLLCALLVGPVSAQEKPDTDQRIADLERRLDAMSRELETQKTGSAMPAVPEEGRYGLGPSASKVYSTSSGLSVGGYGEFLYESKVATLQDGTHVGTEKKADALRMVLYTGYKFSDRIVFNSEIEFEHGGYSDEHPEGEAIAEFYYLDFLINKAINVRAGQLLVPMGFVNELHEPPAFLGARRPQVEQTLIPSTWHENGVGIHGDLPANLTYRVYVMNGLNGARFNASGIADGRQDGNKANAQSLAWTGRLDWTPRPGLLLGTSFYTGNSNQTGIGEAITTTVWDAHAEYRARDFQFRGLYTRSSNSEAGVAALAPSDPAREVGTRQWGGYLEVGYDVLRGSKQALIPFVRYERLDAQQSVVAGLAKDLGQDRTLLTLGAAFKPIPQVAVKADWTRDENRARTGRDQFSLALGYTF